MSKKDPIELKGSLSIARGCLDLQWMELEVLNKEVN